MRAGELADLDAGAVVRIGAGHWLRIPLGKLRNDRNGGVQHSTHDREPLGRPRLGRPGEPPGSASRSRGIAKAAVRLCGARPVVIWSFGPARNMGQALG